jgi:hypothetical protein
MGYCEKHDQKYQDHVPICPICLGEFFATMPSTPLPGCTIDEQYIPNKCGLYLSKPKEPVRSEKPVQMHLFND